MPFSSLDDLVNEITTNGKFQKLPFVRTINTGATSAAGRWHDCFAAAGTGGTGAFSGTAGVATVMNAATAGALPLSPATVSTDTRHLLSMSALTAAATAVPAYLMLVDLLLYYPSCVVSTGAGTTLNNTATLPRYTDGAGVQCAAIVQTALGAATPTITLTYTDQGGTGSNTGTISFPVASAPVGLIGGGGVAASPVFPAAFTAAGDTGIRSIQSYTTANGTTGTVALVLYRPLATIPIVAANTAGERDFLSGIPALPQIADNACLGMFMLVGGALVAGQVVFGELNIGWG